MIRGQSKLRKPEIDLSGPEGNAFVLLGYARQYARLLRLDADAICEEMRRSDYEHLLRVFDQHFGHLVDLVRNQKEHSND